jgi:hypothetical protein
MRSRSTSVPEIPERCHWRNGQKIINSTYAVRFIEPKWGRGCGVACHSSRAYLHTITYQKIANWGRAKSAPETW